MRSTLASLILLALAGCAATPKKEERASPAIDGAAIARSITLCKTSLAEIEPQLGPPSRDGLLGRVRVLTWITAWEPLVRYLGVALDAQGTVVDLYWNLPTEIPWSPANRCS